MVGASPTGARLRFGTDQAGIIDLITVAGGGHVSYNVASALNVWAGAKVSNFRVKYHFGRYDGAGPGPGNSTFPAFINDGASSQFWVASVTPWVGAELFLWNHAAWISRPTSLPTKTVSPTPRRS